MTSNDEQSKNVPRGNKPSVFNFLSVALVFSAADPFKMDKHCGPVDGLLMGVC
jgi:hypothetical protein